MQRFATTLIIIVLACIALIGCEAILGGGEEAPPPPPPAVAPPAQPVPPGVPAPPPTVPQPLAPAVVPPPGAPVPSPVAQPGAPAPAQPGIPAPAAQPGAAPVPAAQPGVAPAPPAQPGVIAPAPGQPVAPPPPTGDVLIDKVNGKKAEVAAAFIPTSAVVKHTLDQKGNQSYQVQLPGPPYCHTYIVAGADELTNIDLAIESPSATKEAEDSVEGPLATVENHCPTAPGIYKLTVSASEGAGEFAVQVFSK